MVDKSAANTDPDGSDVEEIYVVRVIIFVKVVYIATFVLKLSEIA